jgi:hypothetical protein
VATSDVCNVCRRSAVQIDPDEGEEALPPALTPCRWSSAVADWTGLLCEECQRLPLPEILQHLEGAPGGVVAGPARGPYLVERDDGA